MNEMNEQRNKIINATHHDPFQFLGVHFTGKHQQTVAIRTFQPHAASVTLVTATFSRPMNKSGCEGMFELEMERAAFPDADLDPYNYQFQITYFDGAVQTINDPYRFLPALDENDRYLFNFGTHYELYNHMGAHLTSRSGIEGTIFRVWAPSAARVSVLGNFNGWDGRVHPMRSLRGSGIW